MERDATVNHQSNYLKALLACAAVFLCSGVVSAATYSLNVNAGKVAGAWNTGYQAAGTCHLYTVLSSAYGRNISPALKKGANEAGFKYCRGHGVLDDDIGVYADSNGTAVYHWAKWDAVFDSIRAGGIHPVVELSFMPTPLASGSTTSFWYNGHPGNNTAPSDYNKWRDLVNAIVIHCETRYGVDEVRKNWYFEVWNEPNLSYFWIGSVNDYYKLYDYAAEGIRRADTNCRVGGPAASDISINYIDAFVNHCINGTNYATGGKGTKLNFISYHCYAAVEGGNAASMRSYHRQVMGVATKYKFTGNVLNTEWGPNNNSVWGTRDGEYGASFVAKTIHLIYTDTTVRVPDVYSYWCLSDIFEEEDYTSTTAFAGLFGMLLRGEAGITASWDVPKPVFNAFKLLNFSGTTLVQLTGGTENDGVNGFAIQNGDSGLEVLVYNHSDAGNANSSAHDSVALNITNIPFAPGKVSVEQFVIDHNHSNCFTPFAAMGSPNKPSATQWQQLSTAAQLAHYDSAQVVTLTGTGYAKGFNLNTLGVTKLILKKSPSTAVAKPRDQNGGTTTVNSATTAIVSGAIIPLRGEFANAANHMMVYDLCGRLCVDIRINGKQHIDLRAYGIGSGSHVVRFVFVDK